MPTRSLSSPLFRERRGRELESNLIHFSLHYQVTASSVKLQRSATGPARLILFFSFSFLLFFVENADLLSQTAKLLPRLIVRLAPPPLPSSPFSLLSLSPDEIIATVIHAFISSRFPCHGLHAESRTRTDTHHAS